MRENKFRVWCEFEVNGKIEKSMESAASWFLLTQTGKLWSYGPTESPQPLEKEYKKAIPLFYTGLKDKNDKEICEGDIVQFAVDVLDDGTFGNNLKPNYFVLAKVIFKASAYRYDWGSEAPIAHSNCEIIGNIYENPELIGGE